MEEPLLSDWENRPSAFWEPDAGKRVSKEIALLKALRQKGCDRTRDGLSIQAQIDDRNALLLEISKNSNKAMGS